MTAVQRGYRGYIGSRPVRGERTPQQVQNLVIRDYASRQGMAFKLSATEYAMPGCYMMLNAVIEELPTLDGVIVFSMFMLPSDEAKRRRLYADILGQGRELHAALENLSLRCADDIDRFEDILRVNEFAATEMPRAN
ncbi:MAG: sporadic carbohydrate cluster protein, TIGR04323 family [Alphaproteobacteria bacterium]|nr:sporadic carbohydrate cluster protein, TIGR04323 family [Alphaproteobacteria bacterium]